MNLNHLLSWIVPTRMTRSGAWNGPRLDNIWLRWITSLAVLSMAANVLVFSTQCKFAVAANKLAGFSLLLYFGHLFFTRLRPAWSIQLAVGGIALGVTAAYLLIPGIFGHAYFMALGCWLPPLFIYSASVAVAQAKLFKRDRLSVFISLWALNLLGLLSVPLLLLGIFLLILSRMPAPMNIGLCWWAVPFLLAGILGLILRIVFSSLAGAVARKILMPDKAKA